MQLKKVQIRGFIGARDIDLEVPASILVVGGDNESGKSSMYEAITLAATGEMARVKLKNEYQEIVSDGAKTGRILIDFSDGPASFEVPSGKWGESKSLTSPAVRYCLNAHRFAALDDKERRRFLFALSGSTMSGEEVARRMKQREIPDDLITKAVALMRSAGGFDPAAKECARHATEAKGRWREVTGETWGVQKGSSWRAEIPDFDEAAHAKVSSRLQSAKAELAEARTALGRLQGLVEAAQRDKIKVADLRAKLARKAEVEKSRSKLEDDVALTRSDLEEATASLNAIVAEIAASAASKAHIGSPAAPVAGGGSDAGEPPMLLVEAVGALRELLEVVAESDGVALNDADLAAWADYSFPADAAEVIRRFDAAWPEYAAAGTTAADTQHEPLTLEPSTESANLTIERTAAAARVQRLDAALQKAERDLRAADAELGGMAAHQAALDELLTRDPAEVPTDARIDAARGKAAALDSKVASIEVELRTLDKAREATSRAAEQTRHAAELHAEILGWDQAAKALAPDGIQAEIVAAAMQPLNDELARIASRSDWPPVTIDASMVIRYGGRRYELLAESGKWRADACIAAMIAAVSGTRYIMLDRIDVNSIQNRQKLLRWLGTEVRAGTLDGACLLGTLKAPPTGLPADLYTTAWLEHGKNVVVTS